MSLVALVVLACLAVGYTLYGRFVARQYTLDDRRTTPAVSMNDGVDYVPTAKSYLLGQHFSAIAAAGTIAGPILACQLFGWGPSLLWIVLGVVFIGAVHDFSALVASVRHKASSVAELVRDHVSRRAYLAMMAFIWLALIYVLVAFADITASTFLGKTEELPGEVSFNPGGAVAMASLLYLTLSVVMGLVQRKLDPPLWLLTLIFVPATLVAVWAGTKLSTILLLDGQSWGLVICVYCFVAALLPVWLLLQPRGYLGGFILYLSLAFGVAPDEIAGRGPGRIYGDGLGRYIAMVVGEEHLVFARTFGAMAFSTFVFDTIDVATRLGRYILEELFGWQTQRGLRAKAGHAGATLLTIAPPAIVLATAVSTPGQPPAYMKFWTLFGTSNQLLAALTLMGVAMWLWSEGRRVWFVVLPMIFVFAITVWALLVQLVHTQDLVLRGTAAALLALAALVSFEVYRVVRRGRPSAAPIAAE